MAHHTAICQDLIATSQLNETGGGEIDKEQAAYGPAWCQNTQCQSHRQVKQNGRL